MTIRCLLDGLLLPATITSSRGELIAFDGEESFMMEAVEAIFYEVVRASPSEWLELERAKFRLLRQAGDFRWVA